MKKLIIMLGVLAAAVSAHAGAVNWVAQAIRDPLNGSTITSVNMLYVELYYRTGGAFDQTAGYETTFGSGGTFIKGGLVSSLISNQGFVNAASGDLGYQFWNQATAIANRDANGYASFYMNVYYSPTGVAGTGNYTYSGTTHLLTVNLNNITAGDVAATFTGVSPTGHIQWTPAAVPEPATMALFGLGGLALVIRRKMRKEA